MALTLETLQTRDYEVDGLHVRETSAGPGAQPVPLLLVHGGMHGAWNWERFAPFFAEHGWTSHALDWRGHGQSKPLPEQEAIHRPLEDVANDIETVANTLGTPPVVVAHSMGCLATMKFAERNPYAGLVLFTPVPPAEVSPVSIDLPIDPDAMWGPPPFEVTRELFFSGTDEADARRYYDLLVPESAVAVAQGTSDPRASVDPVRICGPGLVVAAEHDVLTPPPDVRKLAGLLGFDYRYARGFGHGVLVDRRWEYVARLAQDWLARHVATTTR